MHRCAQIATDSSQKLPQRLLDIVRLRLAAGLPIDALAEVLALWVRTSASVDDPLLDRLAALAARHTGDPSAHVAAVLAIDEVFGDLAEDDRLVATVTSGLQGRPAA